jgi:MbtH protein
VSDEREDTTIYMVVMNHEEQYSIWPENRELPLGWQDVGKHGPKPDCLVYIEEVWTDMRPKSLRDRMAAAEAETGGDSAAEPGGDSGDSA